MDKINIKPFNEFWLNCSFNAHLSIMTSINPKYNDLAYLNCYTYVNKMQIPKGITIENEDEVQKSILQSASYQEAICFKDKSDEEMLLHIIELLNNQNLFIGVDLFYWLPDTICWQKLHWSHYALVTGYNSNDNTFVVLDSDAYKYGKFEIPRERFITAVRNCPFKPEGYTITINSNPSDFSLELNAVIQNAEKIIENIENHLEANDIWEYSPYHMQAGQHFEFFSMFAYQIMNRQIANSLLFKRLAELKLINDKTCAGAVNSFNELRIGWETIKNIFIKSGLMSPRALDIDRLIAIKNSLLKQEKAVWEHFVY